MLRFLITAERDLCPEVVAWLQSEFARRMEKGEQDFKYKVDQVQESLADTHKAHLRQVCPSLPFDTCTLPFAYLPLPTGCPCCASCTLWQYTLPFKTLAMPSAYTSAHWMPLLCFLCLVAPLPFDTHALPSAYPSLPTGCPCCASWALWQHNFFPLQDAISHENTTWRHGCGCAVHCMRTVMTAVLHHSQAGCIAASCRQPMLAASTSLLASCTVRVPILTEQT